MSTTKVNLITLDDGRVFPTFDGETLSWSIGLYHTWNEECAGFPRMRAVIRAMIQHRPVQVERERREMLRGSFDRTFGHNARKALQVIEEELGLGVNTSHSTTQNAVNTELYVIYHASSSSIVFTGERCKLIRNIPHGTYFDASRHIIDPQPTEFRPDLGRYIGEWLEAETDEGERFRAPRSWFQEVRK